MRATPIHLLGSKKIIKYVQVKKTSCRSNCPAVLKVHQTMLMLSKRLCITDACFLG